MAPTESRRAAIGLALSGGGFRATAFHLGVLQRLRELGLLHRIVVVSTVSGGSIAGASWLCWHIVRGNTLDDDKAWDKYAASLLWVMSRPMGGVRGIVFLVTFLAPAVAFAAGAALLGWLFGPFGRATVAAMAAGIVLAAYLVWHYAATSILARCYSRDLVGDTTLADLDPLGAPYTCPLLLINATGLNNGEHLVFASREPSTDYAAMLPALMLRTAPRHALVRGMPPVSMPNTTHVAQAVAASSAIPGAFAPIRFTDVMRQVVGFLRTPLWGKSALRGTYLATDGGVYDNQGTHLLGGLCEHLIVSDGSATVREEQSPSTWQLWPPGRGVLWRAQEISYSRARELGYERLEERRTHYDDLVDVLREAGVPPDKAEALLDKRRPLLESYSYIELVPPRNFAWAHGEQRLPDVLVPLVAGIRTDLDTFSWVELSALMFHGYTMIDHCLRTYQRALLPEEMPPLAFRFPFTGLFADWSNPTGEEIARAAKHLTVAGSRVGLWRRLYRRINDC